MEINVNTLPQSPEILQQLLLDLQQALSATQSELTSSQTELIAYKEKYIRLLEEIRLAKQQRFAPGSESYPGQSDLFDEAGVELPPEVQAQLTDEIVIDSYARKKHPVRRPLPADMPREIIVHDIADSEKQCTCGMPLQKFSEEVTEQLKYIPAQLSVIRHVRPQYACKACQGNVKIAALPTLLLPKTIVTPELAAHTIVAKYVDHLPLYRQETIWQRLGIDLPRSSLCGWLLKIAELCKPLIQELRTLLLQETTIQADETTVQVLEEVGRSNTAKSYMWVYKSGASEKPILVFDYQTTRNGQHAQTFLQGFKGYLQTDAYGGYRWTENDKDITAVYCMAHARRPFAELAKLDKKQKGLAHEALKFFQKLYVIEKVAREKSFTATERFNYRQQQAPPILKAFHAWLNHHSLKTPEQTKLGKAMAYCLTHWQLLTNYLLDGRLEIDNNLIENAIRPFALGRKNWLFAGSPSGAEAGAILYSLIETCKANQVEPYRYFCAMLHQIRSCKTAEDYRKLLPQFIQL